MNGALIPHTPIAVDFWRVRQCPEAKVFFLTHLHGDHTSGLTPSWSRPIYCTHITKKLLMRKFQIKEELINALNTNESHVIKLDEEEKETMSVTVIDAHHCPGSAMFLFQGYFGTILHTGDFRYTEKMFIDTPLSTKRTVDILYLDNTYSSPECVFPTRRQAMEDVFEILEKHPDHQILFGMRSLGKEDLLVAMALQIQTWVVVSEDQYELLGIMDMPNVFTTDRSVGRIHVIPVHHLNSSTLMTWNNQQPTIGIIPTALFSGTDNPYQFQPGIFVIPYSDHSSYQELHRFVEKVRPKKIVPIVVAKSRGPCGKDISERAQMRVYRKYMNLQPIAPFKVPRSVEKYMKKVNLEDRRGHGKKRKYRQEPLLSRKRSKVALGVSYNDDEGDDEGSDNSRPPTVIRSYPQRRLYHHTHPYYQQYQRQAGSPEPCFSSDSSPQREDHEREARVSTDSDQDEDNNDHEREGIGGPNSHQTTPPQTEETDINQPIEPTEGWKLIPVTLPEDYQPIWSTIGDPLWYFQNIVKEKMEQRKKAEKEQESTEIAEPSPEGPTDSIGLRISAEFNISTINKHLESVSIESPLPADLLEVDVDKISALHKQSDSGEAMKQINQIKKDITKDIENMGEPIPLYVDRTPLSSRSTPCPSEIEDFIHDDPCIKKYHGASTVTEKYSQTTRGGTIKKQDDVSNNVSTHLIKKNLVGNGVNEQPVHILETTSDLGISKDSGTSEVHGGSFSSENQKEVQCFVQHEPPEPTSGFDPSPSIDVSYAAVLNKEGNHSSMDKPRREVLSLETQDTDSKKAKETSHIPEEIGEKGDKGNKMESKTSGKIIDQKSCSEVLQTVEDINDDTCQCEPQELDIHVPPVHYSDGNDCEEIEEKNNLLTNDSIELGSHPSDGREVNVLPVKNGQDESTSCLSEIDVSVERNVSSKLGSRKVILRKSSSEKTIDTNSSEPRFKKVKRIDGSVSGARENQQTEGVLRTKKKRQFKIKPKYPSKFGLQKRAQNENNTRVLKVKKKHTQSTSKPGESACTVSTLEPDEIPSSHTISKVSAKVESPLEVESAGLMKTLAAKNKSGAFEELDRLSLGSEDLFLTEDEDNYTLDVTHSLFKADPVTSVVKKEHPPPQRLSQPLNKVCGNLRPVVSTPSYYTTEIVEATSTVVSTAQRDSNQGAVSKLPLEPVHPPTPELVAERGVEGKKRGLSPTVITSSSYVNSSLSNIRPPVLYAQSENGDTPLRDEKLYEGEETVIFDNSLSSNSGIPYRSLSHFSTWKADNPATVEKEGVGVNGTSSSCEKSDQKFSDVDAEKDGENINENNEVSPVSVEDEDRGTGKSSSLKSQKEKGLDVNIDSYSGSYSELDEAALSDIKRQNSLSYIPIGTDPSKGESVHGEVSSTVSDSENTTNNPIQQEKQISPERDDSNKDRTPEASVSHGCGIKKSPPFDFSLLRTPEYLYDADSTGRVSSQTRSFFEEPYSLVDSTDCDKSGRPVYIHSMIGSSKRSKTSARSTIQNQSPKVPITPSRNGTSETEKKGDFELPVSCQSNNVGSEQGKVYDEEKSQENQDQQMCTCESMGNTSEEGESKQEGINGVTNCPPLSPPKEQIGDDVVGKVALELPDTKVVDETHDSSVVDIATSEYSSNIIEGTSVNSQPETNVLTAAPPVYCDADAAANPAESDSTIQPIANNSDDNRIRNSDTNAATPPNEENPNKSEANTSQEDATQNTQDQCHGLSQTPANDGIIEPITNNSDENHVEKSDSTAITPLSDEESSKAGANTNQSNTIQNTQDQCHGLSQTQPITNNSDDNRIGNSDTNAATPLNEENPKKAETKKSQEDATQNTQDQCHVLSQTPCLEGGEAPSLDNLENPTPQEVNNTGETLLVQGNNSEMPVTAVTYSNMPLGTTVHHPNNITGQEQVTFIEMPGENLVHQQNNMTAPGQVTFIDMPGDVLVPHQNNLAVPEQLTFIEVPSGSLDQHQIGLDSSGQLTFINVANDTIVNNLADLQGHPQLVNICYTTKDMETPVSQEGGDALYTQANTYQVILENQVENQFFLPPDSSVRTVEAHEDHTLNTTTVPNTDNQLCLSDLDEPCSSAQYTEVKDKTVPPCTTPVPGPQKRKNQASCNKEFEKFLVTRYSYDVGEGSSEEGLDARDSYPEEGTKGASTRHTDPLIKAYLNPPMEPRTIPNDNTPEETDMLQNQENASLKATEDTSNRTQSVNFIAKESMDIVPPNQNNPETNGRDDAPISPTSAILFTSSETDDFSPLAASTKDDSHKSNVTKSKYMGTVLKKPSQDKTAHQSGVSQLQHKIRPLKKSGKISSPRTSVSPHNPTPPHSEKSDISAENIPDNTHSSDSKTRPESKAPQVHADAGSMGEVSSVPASSVKDQTLPVSPPGIPCRDKSENVQAVPSKNTVSSNTTEGTVGVIKVYDSFGNQVACFTDNDERPVVYPPKDPDQEKQKSSTTEEHPDIAVSSSVSFSGVVTSTPKQTKRTLVSPPLSNIKMVHSPCSPTPDIHAVGVMKNPGLDTHTAINSELISKTIEPSPTSLIRNKVHPSKNRKKRVKKEGLVSSKPRPKEAGKLKAPTPVGLVRNPSFPAPLPEVLRASGGDLNLGMGSLQVGTDKAVGGDETVNLTLPEGIALGTRPDEVSSKGNTRQVMITLDGTDGPGTGSSIPASVMIDAAIFSQGPDAVQKEIDRLTNELLSSIKSAIQGFSSTDPKPEGPPVDEDPPFDAQEEVEEEAVISSDDLLGQCITKGITVTSNTPIKYKITTEEQGNLEIPQRNKRDKRDKRHIRHKGTPPGKSDVGGNLGQRGKRDQTKGTPYEGVRFYEEVSLLDSKLSSALRPGKRATRGDLAGIKHAADSYDAMIRKRKSAERVYLQDSKKKREEEDKSKSMSINEMLAQICPSQKERRAGTLGSKRSMTKRVFSDKRSPPRKTCRTNLPASIRLDQKIGRNSEISKWITLPRVDVKKLSPRYIQRYLKNNGRKLKVCTANERKRSLQNVEQQKSNVTSKEMGKENVSDILVGNKSVSSPCQKAGKVNANEKNNPESGTDSPSQMNTKAKIESNIKNESEPMDCVAEPPDTLSPDENISVTKCESNMFSAPEEETSVEAPASCEKERSESVKEKELQEPSTTKQGDEEMQCFENKPSEVRVQRLPLSKLPENKMLKHREEKTVQIESNTEKGYGNETKKKSEKVNTTPETTVRPRAYPSYLRITPASGTRNDPSNENKACVDNKTMKCVRRILKKRKDRIPSGTLMMGSMASDSEESLKTSSDAETLKIPKISSLVLPPVDSDGDADVESDPSEEDSRVRFKRSAYIDKEKCDIKSKHLQSKVTEINSAELTVINTEDNLTSVPSEILRVSQETSKGKDLRDHGPMVSGNVLEKDSSLPKLDEKNVSLRGGKTDVSHDVRGKGKTENLPGKEVEVDLGQKECNVPLNPKNDKNQKLDKVSPPERGANAGTSDSADDIQDRVSDAESQDVEELFKSGHDIVKLQTSDLADDIQDHVSDAESQDEEELFKSGHGIVNLQTSDLADDIQDHVSDAESQDEEELFKSGHDIVKLQTIVPKDVGVYKGEVLPEDSSNEITNGDGENISTDEDIAWSRIQTPDPTESEFTEDEGDVDSLSHMAVDGESSKLSPVNEDLSQNGDDDDDDDDDVDDDDVFVVVDDDEQNLIPSSVSELDEESYLHQGTLSESDGDDGSDLIYMGEGFTPEKVGINRPDEQAEVESDEKIMIYEIHDANFGQEDMDGERLVSNENDTRKKKLSSRSDASSTDGYQESNSMNETRNKRPDKRGITVSDREESAKDLQQGGRQSNQVQESDLHSVQHKSPHNTEQDHVCSSEQPEHSGARVVDHSSPPSNTPDGGKKQVKKIRCHGCAKCSSTQQPALLQTSPKSFLILDGLNDRGCRPHSRPTARKRPTASSLKTRQQTAKAAVSKQGDKTDGSVRAGGCSGAGSDQSKKTRSKDNESMDSPNKEQERHIENQQEVDNQSPAGEPSHSSTIEHSNGDDTSPPKTPPVFKRPFSFPRIALKESAISLTKPGNKTSQDRPSSVSRSVKLKRKWRPRPRVNSRILNSTLKRVPKVPTGSSRSKPRKKKKKKKVKVKSKAAEALEKSKELINVVLIGGDELDVLGATPQHVPSTTADIDITRTVKPKQAAPRKVYSVQKIVPSKESKRSRRK